MPLPTQSQLKYAFLREIEAILADQQEINEAVLKQQFIKRSEKNKKGEFETFQAVDWKSGYRLFDNSGQLLPGQKIAGKNIVQIRFGNMQGETLTSYQIEAPSNMRANIQKFLTKEAADQLNPRSQLILEAVFREAQIRITKQFSLDPKTEDSLEIQLQKKALLNLSTPDNFAFSACQQLTIANIKCDQATNLSLESTMQTSLIAALHKPEYRLAALVSNIQDMAHDYPTLKHSKHQKDISALLNVVNDIMANNETNDKKYEAIFNVVQRAFLTEKEHFCHPAGIKSMFQKTRQESQFFDGLNHHLNKHHYARMLGLVLQAEAVNNPSHYQQFSAPDWFEKIPTIWIGTHPVYQKRVMDLLKPKQYEALEIFRKTAEKVLPNNSLVIPLLQAYRLVKNQAVLDVNLAKTIWPDLTKKFKLSDRAINRLIKEKDFKDTKLFLLRGKKADLHTIHTQIQSFKTRLWTYQSGKEPDSFKLRFSTNRSLNQSAQ